MERLRLRLSSAEALPQLALLGVLTGFIAGVVIIALRLAVDSAQAAFLPGGQLENYEGLHPALRLLLPIGGALLIGVLFQRLSHTRREVGVVHVMERLAYHQAHVPWRNGVVQFVGAALAIVSGQSVGREGPSVHLGATAGSELTRRMGLPHNTGRTLVACGVAAAIAASFNTPLAGVIFAMEVVMMEYTATGFGPVILAAVAATILSWTVYGHDPAFAVPALSAGTLSELPWIVILGLVVGTLAAIYVRLLEIVTRSVTGIPYWLRVTLGGAAVGLCALAVPEVMGVGYDTVSGVLHGEVGLALMLALIAAKLIATAFAIGLGIPGGLIGPTLVIGAAAGAATGLVGQQILPVDVSSGPFYAIVGMGAMMGATLQAPLAALTAMLELTGNPRIIMPGLLVLIVSALTSRELYGQPSVYRMLMRIRGRDYRNDPVVQSLRRVGVASAMERRIKIAERMVARDEAEQLLEQNPRWIVVRDEREPTALLPGTDLAAFLQGHPDTGPIDLLEVPAKRRALAPVSLQADLQEAYDALRDAGAEALFVRRRIAPGFDRIYGVLTEQDLEASYHY